MILEMRFRIFIVREATTQTTLPCQGICTNVETYHRNTAQSSSCNVYVGLFWE